MFQKEFILYLTSFAHSFCTILYYFSLDPSMELQACGRIHRLGQTRDVLVKKFVFKDTVEESIVDLHERMKAGSIQVQEGSNCWPREAIQFLMRK